MPENTKTKDETTAEPAADQQKQPQLGALEEDDEFEEFPVADWDDSETSLAQFSKNNSTGDSTKPADEQLWEDNWDEDDVEDEFSKQLREELAKTSAAAQPATTTDTVMS